MRPAPTEFAPYFDRYISLVPQGDIVKILAAQVAPFRAGLASCTDDRAGFRYAPDKWSVREVIGHLVDAERIFGCRALWFARGDPQPLPSFDQDAFAAVARHDRYPIAELVDEFCAIRESHILMFRHLEDDAWTRIGTAGGNPMSPRAAAYVMAGHVNYHVTLLRDRYDVPISVGAAA